MLRAARRVRGTAKILTDRVAESFQRRLIACLIELRASALLVIEAARHWRSAHEGDATQVLCRGDTLLSVPELFVWRGENYLLKILTVFDAMPLPGGSDPFLHRWFGRDVRWWYFGDECLPLQLLEKYRDELPMKGSEEEEEV